VWADQEPGQNSPKPAAPARQLQARCFRRLHRLVRPDGLTLIDSITYGQQTSDVSQGRFADGASTIYTLAKATTNGVNLIPGYNTRPFSDAGQPVRGSQLHQHV